MAKKLSTNNFTPNANKRKKKKTSIGYSSNSRPLNKHKRRNNKKYKGQGK